MFKLPQVTGVAEYQRLSGGKNLFNSRAALLGDLRAEQFVNPAAHHLLHPFVETPDKGAVGGLYHSVAINQIKRFRVAVHQ